MKTTSIVRVERHVVNLIGRCCLIVSVSTALALCAAVQSVESQPLAVFDRDEISFDQHIRPLLNKHCTACHGGVKQAADLSFIYESDLAEVIEPSNAASSELMVRITEEDNDDRMPPPEHGPRLTAEEVSLFRQWIDNGAKWEPHWAHRPPQRSAAAHVKDQAWCRQPLDSFVLASLESKNIRPAPPESPSRWLRRVSLDLVGLPPTLHDRKSFLEDLDHRGEPAYEAVVDRLLGSDNFGERWATVWFDQVRYADSQGLGQDGDRTIWKYRDWVIEALNEDMPYDEFTIKQIAGDLLPGATIHDQLATAVHRLTQTNEEGGTDDEEFRVAAVLDRVNTIWQTWQGTTFGCVQCHSHPYDPIKHREYYEFAALFNNTLDSDLVDDWPWIPVPNQETDREDASKLWNRSQQLRQQVWEREYELAHKSTAWHSATGLQVEGNARLAVETVDGVEQFFLDDNPRNWLAFSIEFPIHEREEPIVALRLHVIPQDAEKALAHSEWGFVLGHFQAELISKDRDETGSVTAPLPPEEADGQEKDEPSQESGTAEGESEKGGSEEIDSEKVDSAEIDGEEIDTAPELRIARVIGDDPFPRFDPNESLKPKTNSGFAAFTRINHARQAVFLLEEPLQPQAGDRLRILLKTHRSHAGGPLIIKRGFIEMSGDAELREKLDAKELNDLREALRQTEQALGKIDATRTPIVRERAPHLSRPMHQFIRGLFLTKGPQVDAGVPGSFGHGDQVKDRLGLAKWLVEPKNPLTARVAVNRFWARMFGVGLVATEEDFGSAGDKPSHPALLDDLAVRFQEDYRWSIKKVLREVALSSAYRQSAKPRPELQDPGNRHLAKGPRQTLSAEMVRDQALALSGLLADKLYGPPLHPPLPPGVWKPFQDHDKWETPEPGEPNRYRRSVYTAVKRSIPYPIHAAFDAPTREFCAPRRLRSNSPIQSLMIMNDLVFVECAAALAERIEAFPGTLEEKIQQGFVLATCREPSKNELARLAALYKDQDEPSMNGVATVLLNLDETLTK